MGKIIIKNAVKRVTGWLYYITLAGDLVMKRLDHGYRELREAREYYKKNHGR